MRSNPDKAVRSQWILTMPPDLRPRIDFEKRRNTPLNLSLDKMEANTDFANQIRMHVGAKINHERKMPPEGGIFRH
jgi:hypothetical protein